MRYAEFGLKEVPVQKTQHYSRVHPDARAYPMRPANVAGAIAAIGATGTGSTSAPGTVPPLRGAVPQQGQAAQMPGTVELSTASAQSETDSAGNAAVPQAGSRAGQDAASTQPSANPLGRMPDAERTSIGAISPGESTSTSANSAIIPPGSVVVPNQVDTTGLSVPPAAARTESKERTHSAGEQSVIAGAVPVSDRATGSDNTGVAAARVEAPAITGAAVGHDDTVGEGTAGQSGAAGVGSAAGEGQSIRPVAGQAGTVGVAVGGAVAGAEGGSAAGTTFQAGRAASPGGAVVAGATTVGA